MDTKKSTMIYRSLILKSLILFGLSFSSGLAKTYSVAEIYLTMCKTCHGEKAQGNTDKGAPPLNHFTQEELSSELFHIKSDGFQSSGSEHHVMVQNQKLIEKKGMDYHPDDMALYIYSNFNQKAKQSDNNMLLKYSAADAFEQMCSKCHGTRAQGDTNKGGPALNEYTLHELEIELINLETDGFQSSGSHSTQMQKILKNMNQKGIKYHPKDMAIYIYYSFNKKSKKQ